TLRDLHREQPEADLFFITGADALQNILTWKDTEEIFELAHFVGVTRPGHELDTSGLPEDGVTLIEVPAMAISSTDCRTRVAAGAPVWYLVPDGVVQYINKYALYTGGDGRWPSARPPRAADAAPAHCLPRSRPRSRRGPRWRPTASSPPRRECAGPSPRPRPTSPCRPCASSDAAPASSSSASSPRRRRRNRRPPLRRTRPWRRSAVTT